jgi:site-specific DNA-adenine methylase
VSPRRPVLRYHGGKWKLAEWVISLFPPHRTYVEPFGGAASVLMRKSRAYAEIYGDMDGEVVNVFEMSDGEHVELAGHLHQVQGMVVLSGYHSPMYDELYQGWERHERPALADKAKPRLEVVWLNPACVEARRRAQEQGVLAITPAKGPASVEKLLQPKGAKRVSRK